MKHLQDHFLQAHALAQPAEADGFHELFHLIGDRAKTIGDLGGEASQFGFILCRRVPRDGISRRAAQPALRWRGA